jgi:thymidylate synthase
MHPRVVQIRQEFSRLLSTKKFTSINREKSMTGLMGNETIELISPSFIADEPAIFGEVNHEWVKREEAWYESMSLNVNDIPGGPPKVWAAVADKDGYINSNYGWCIWSAANGFLKDSRALTELSQYNFTLEELKKNPESRRAVMIYTRPSMWLDYNRNGRSDFMCTNTVQYLIRDGALHSVVQMRSNDAIFGYKGDRAWQLHVLELLANDLGVNVGNIYWNVGSLHVYARHFYLIDPVNYPKD